MQDQAELLAWPEAGAEHARAGGPRGQRPFLIQHRLRLGVGRARIDLEDRDPARSLERQRARAARGVAQCKHQPILVPVGAERVARAGVAMPLMSAGSASPTNSCAVPANRSRPISSRLTASNGTMATLRWPGLLQQAQASASWPMASVTSVAQAAARRRRCEGMVTGGAVETEPPIVCSDAVEIVSAPGRQAA